MKRTIKSYEEAKRIVQEEKDNRKPLRSTEEERLVALHLYVNEGWSMTAIANQLGRERNTIKWWLIKFGVPLRHWKKKNEN